MSFVVDDDKIVVVGSHQLMHQLKQFVKRTIPGYSVRIMKEGNFSRLDVYSYTARTLAEVLCSDTSTTNVVSNNEMLNSPNLQKLQTYFIAISLLHFGHSLCTIR